MVLEPPNLGPDEITPRRRLYRAIRGHDLDEVKQVLAEHPELIGYSTSSTPTLLHEAAGYGTLPMMEYFISLGMDPNCPEPDYATPLTRAVTSGDLEKVRYLLSLGANPSIGRPVFRAIKHDSLEMVRMLVEARLDLSKKYLIGHEEDGLYMTALDWAAGHPEIAAYLRSQGAPEMLPDNSPVPHCESRNAQIVQYMAETFGPVRRESMQEIFPTGLPIAIHVIPSSDSYRRTTLFTTGMSALPMTTPEGHEALQYAELLIHLPPDWPLDEASLTDPKYQWPIVWLKRLARLPHDANTFLGGPFSILENGNKGQLIEPHLPFTAFLMAAMDRVSCDDGIVVQLYTLVLLYPEEVALWKRSDLPTLLNALDRLEISYTFDPDRKNAATDIS